MRTHLKVLATIHLTLGIWGAAMMSLMWFFMAAVIRQMDAVRANLPASRPEGQMMVEWVTRFSHVFLAAVVLFCLLQVVLAAGLYRNRRWARNLGIALSALSLPMLPIGTALGAYGLWVLFSAEGTALLDGSDERGGPAGRLQAT